MPNDSYWIFFIFIFLPFFMFYGTCVTIRRREDAVSCFYWPLRKKYPRSYVKQHKIVKSIRKRFGLDTKGTIHWMHCLYHYLQLVMLISPILLLVLFLFMPPLKAVLISGIFAFGPIVFIALSSDILMIVLALRCEKIKKTEPEYSKCKISYW